LIQYIKKTLSKPTPAKRAMFFLFSDGLIFAFSLYIAYSIKYGFKFYNADLANFFFLKAIFLFFSIKFLVFSIFRLYHFTWKYVGLNDLYNLLKACGISLLSIIFIYFIFSNSIYEWLPKSVILSDFFITFILTGFLRISKRLYIEIFNPMLAKKGKPTLIIGADSLGEMIVRDLRKSNFKEYDVVGFLDNDQTKQGFYIHDVRVLGTTELLEKLIQRFKVEVLILADHNLNLKEIQLLYTISRKAGIKEIKVIPRLYPEANIDVTVKKLEDIRVEDLINRQEIVVDINKIKSFLFGKKILITGAAGSIGSEIVRQIILFEPQKIILFEIDETEIFYLEKQLIESNPEYKDKIVSVIGDIRDENKINSVFSNYKPDIVFHAAAYKHVPLLETNPEEAIKVNIFGTYNLCKMANNHNVEKFVNISTDKAVKPESVMGMSKRFGEYIAKSFNENGGTQFISVRFGNVLGSRGSVVPIFLDQLRKGGPITITHPDMKRYFMTIPEAVTLVLQAALLGEGGEIMVLDMGEPIYIQSLAEELIKLHGLVPNIDIEIEYTGIRPGEKIFEEILTAEEGTDKTTHERVYVAKVSANLTGEQLEQYLKNFEIIINNDIDATIIKKDLNNSLKLDTY
jgi:FlaA1/EpsC-like NDP-sugar epimerase